MHIGRAWLCYRRILCVIPMALCRMCVHSCAVHSECLVGLVCVWWACCALHHSCVLVLQSVVPSIIPVCWYCSLLCPPSFLCVGTAVCCALHHSCVLVLQSVVPSIIPVCWYCSLYHSCVLVLQPVSLTVGTHARGLL